MKATLVLMVTLSLVTVLCAVDTAKPFELTTLIGEKFKNCRITKATPEGLTIVHDNGVSRISFTALSEEWRKMFDYDPQKAQEFAQAEEKKRQLAEEKRAELERKRRVMEEEHLEALAAAERKSIADEARAVKEYQDSVKAANTPPAPLAPLPGDATPNLSMPIPQPIMQTEAVVPTVPPIGDPFSPTRIRSQSYILTDGYYPGGYYGGYYGGYPNYYQTYQPIYSNPGCNYPCTPCPTSSIIPGVHGTISTGAFSIRINR